MKWQARRTSRNIEDRRVRGGRGTVPPSGGGREITEADGGRAEVVLVTLADTDDVWLDMFHQQVDGAYPPVTLVLYKGVRQLPWGGASRTIGPFYCPCARKVYLDTGVFTTMSRQLGASGEFAAAYVVAQEVAHHVQNERGILGQSNRMRAQVDQTESNTASIHIELQADCYSGTWARNAQARFGSLEQGDIGEAMNAAKQIGEDTLQRNAGRPPMPHTFTHGTSAQRQRRFTTGFETGDLRGCDTFSTNDLWDKKQSSVEF